MDKFKAINQLEDIKVRKRYVKDTVTKKDDGGDQPQEDNYGETDRVIAPQYIDHKIVSEIYTNDHVSASAIY
jgi:hypothetical protein